MQGRTEWYNFLTDTAQKLKRILPRRLGCSRNENQSRNQTANAFSVTGSLLMCDECSPKNDRFCRFHQKMIYRRIVVSSYRRIPSHMWHRYRDPSECVEFFRRICACASWKIGDRYAVVLVLVHVLSMILSMDLVLVPTVHYSCMKYDENWLRHLNASNRTNYWVDKAFQHIELYCESNQLFGR